MLHIDLTDPEHHLSGNSCAHNKVLHPGRGIPFIAEEYNWPLMHMQHNKLFQVDVVDRMGLGMGAFQLLTKLIRLAVQALHTPLAALRKSER